MIRRTHKEPRSKTMASMKSKEAGYKRTSRNRKYFNYFSKREKTKPKSRKTLRRNGDTRQTPSSRRRATPIPSPIPTPTSIPSTIPIHGPFVVHLLVIGVVNFRLPLILGLSRSARGHKTERERARLTPYAVVRKILCRNPILSLKSAQDCLLKTRLAKTT